MVTLSATLERPQARIRYADLAGPGRAVVLVHGAGVDHTIYAGQIDALRAGGHRVIALDLRGHGASGLDDGAAFTADAALADLVALIEELQLNAPVLVGHSLGGNLAQELARRHPRLLGGLVVIDSTWNHGPLSRLDRLGLRLAAPSLAMIPASRLPGLMASASAVTPEAVATLERTFARMPKPRFLEVWRATATLVRPEPGYRTSVPLTLIRGEHDRTGNIARAMSAWARAERVDEQVIADAGHLPTLDAPEAVSALLIGAAGH